MQQNDSSWTDADEIGHNDTPNETFHAVLDARLSRRSMLLGGLGGTAAVALGGLVPTEAEAKVTRPWMGFKPVAKSVADMVSVPSTYSFGVLIAVGDPLRDATPDYANNGTDTDFEWRSGDHHDGMEYFGLSDDGLSADRMGSNRALLATNHEALTDQFLHVNGVSARPRPVSESLKEIPAHGISVVEIQRQADGNFKYLRNSAYNRRITPNTPAVISGPARGNALMKTVYSPTGTTCRGTINNCGTGYTPWGTMLSGEENWAGYFFRNSNDNTARGNDKSVASFTRYGRNAGSSSRHGWETSGSDDQFRRFDISKTGTSADGSDDYRNEMNTFGYMLEVDPYSANSAPVKRTGLGRFAHESAAFARLVEGRPLAVYMGDDSRNEYMYKFVSNAKWTAADAYPADRLATGSKYLDKGKLYVAKFNADGTGAWVELTIANPLIAGYAGYAFADQADVLVNARLAADAVGATKMDRPEWCATNPNTGEIFYTLTNNSNRKVDVTSSSQSQVDAANPRSYSDSYNGGAAGSPGNVNGHILRMKERDNLPGALTFRWDVYLFGAEAGSDLSKVNLSSLTDNTDLSSPDGLWFSPTTGICWIQTDDGAYTDKTNCMMLAALPGTLGDGSVKTLTYTKADGSTLTVQTPVGAAPIPEKLKRFLVGPVDCEITGVCETPDGKTMFVNIQHPGESISQANVANPAAYTSHFPGNIGYGAGGAMARPRSATIVIRKNDGGVIGS
ncbi:PhoX family protein [Ideonella sp.]|uniref:PhoX family protein n=1 Tax=Ideonella sp. TaxID=1929293 RepID=UPI003BB505D9